MMACGIGVTPLLALLGELPYRPGEATLIYRARNETEIAFREELEWFAARRGVRVISSIVLAADTCTSVLTDLLAYAAEATARLVLAAAARNPGHRHRRSGHPTKSAAATKIASIEGPAEQALRAARRPRNGGAHVRPTKIKGV